MAGVRQPRTVEAAAELCELWAELDGQIATIEEGRQADIAAINADADRAANDLIAQREAIAEKLQPWWAKAGEALTEGKRKSLEIGGCMVGTRTGKESLGLPEGKPADLIARLKEMRLATGLLNITVSLDKRAIAKALDTKRGEKLGALGYRMVPGEDTFFITRTEQGGTRSGL